MSEGGSSPVNPWYQLDATETWVKLKADDYGRTSRYLTKCEWVSTIIVTTLACGQLYMERALFITSLLGATDHFDWNVWPGLILILLFYLGNMMGQIISGYLADNRLDILSSVSGVDELTGHKTLVSPIESSLGTVMFGEENVNRTNEEEYLHNLAMDQLMQSNGVVSGGSMGHKIRPKRIKHLKRLQKQLGKQYTKYGARWLVAVHMLIWGGCALAIGLISKSSNNAASILIFMPLRFVMGTCNGVVIVSSQSLIAKEVPPHRRSLGSSLLGLAFPLGSMLGLMIAFYGNADPIMMGNVVWIGVGGLCFFFLLILWLIFYIENVGDQTDLLDHKDTVIAPVRGEEAKEKKGCLKKCCRLSSRIFCFSWLESIWLMKFRSIRSMALFNFFWTFSVMSACTWVPTLVYDSVIYFEDFAEFVDVGEYKSLSPEYIHLMAVTEAPEDKLTTKGLAGVKVNETYATAALSTNATTAVTAAVTAVPDDQIQAEINDIMAALEKLQAAAAVPARRRLKEETFFYHNITHTSPINKVDAEAQLLMWTGMSACSFISIAITELVQYKLAPFIAYAIGVIVGTVAPATLSIYVALEMIKSDAISFGDHQTYRSYLFLIIPAMLLTGFALPPLFTSQNWIAPKKAGSTYSVISVSGAFGDMIASLCSFVLPILSGHIGIGYYCLTCISIGTGLFLALVSYFCGNMDPIPELNILTGPELRIKNQDLELPKQTELN